MRHGLLGVKDYTKYSEKDMGVKNCWDNQLGNSNQDTRYNCCNFNSETWQEVQDCISETNATLYFSGLRPGALHNK